MNRKNLHPLEMHSNKKEEKNKNNNKGEKDDDYDDDLTLENFKIIDGRKFINIEESCEFLPVDRKSMSKMEILEILSQHIWNGKFSSPVKEKLENGGASVIDIGCGPATWLMFMAEEFPKSSFVGIDIVIDSKKELPTNLAIIEHNIFDGLPFPNDTFDFVRQKSMLGSLTTGQWPFVIDELIRITKPGGWIEFMVIITKYNNEILKLRESRGIIVGPFYKYIERKLITTDKIIEINHQMKKFPLGGHGIIGEMFRQVITDSIETIRPYLSSIMGLSLEEYDKMIRQCDLEDVEYKTYLKNYRKFINIEKSCEFLPVDDKSMSIMEIVEVLSQHIWNGKFSSPVKETLKNGGASVIDIGCGPATWLMFMAEEFPKSSFVGIDIMIDLNDSKKELPENLAIIEHNIFDGLPFPDDTFDFVHQKSMLGSLTIDQWPFVIDELIRITKPGGWIEFMVIITKDNNEITKLRKSRGVIDGSIYKYIEKKLITTDKIIEIDHPMKKFPLGGHGIVGEMFRQVMTDSIETIRPYLSSIMGISLEEYDEMIRQCHLEDVEYKTYIKNY
ncbi:15150_t:CDS:10, partial [Entrophospora sp. SA101]